MLTPCGGKPLSVADECDRDTTSSNDRVVVLSWGLTKSVSECVFITAVPITKLFARGGGGMEDMCYERLRAKAGVN